LFGTKCCAFCVSPHLAAINSPAGKTVKLMPGHFRINSVNFIDSHCHFDFAEFDGDRANVWQSCKALGVDALVIPGVSPADLPRATQIASQNPGIYYAAGLHPWWVKENSAQDIVATQLRAAIKQPGCVAIGECGLDAVIDTPLALQLPLFELQLQLAAEQDLPIIIHCRRAHNELISVLKQTRLSRGGVIHAFSGSYDMAKQYWGMGFYLGIGGTITYDRAHKTRAAVKAMPLESLLLESDAPDMPLQGKQGQRNSPEYIPLIADALAQLCGESTATIAAQTTRNAQTLFKISLT
jgi:TatD DNase family protein